jgi:hypothetical protein
VGEGRSREDIVENMAAYIRSASGSGVEFVWDMHGIVVSIQAR